MSVSLLEPVQGSAKILGPQAAPPHLIGCKDGYMRQAVGWTGEGRFRRGISARPLKRCREQTGLALQLEGICDYERGRSG